MSYQLPHGWTVAPLGHHVERSKSTWDETEQPRWYLGLEHIQGDGLGVANPQEVTNDVQFRSTKLLFRTGDVLYGRMRTYLNKVWIADRNGVCSSEIFVLRVRPTIDSVYLSHFLRSERFVALASGLQKGARSPRLSYEDFADISIPLPGIGEQRRLAKILDAIDEARSKDRLIIRELAALLPAIFREIFGDLRHQQRKWIQQPLGEVADVTSGLQVTPARTSGPDDREDATRMSVPYLRVAHVFRERIDLITEPVTRMLVTKRELDTRSLERGDILVVEGHGNLHELGRAALWFGDIAPCVHQNHLIRIRTKDHRVTAEYVSGLINSTLGRDYVMRSGRTTSGLNTISAGTIKKLPIPIAPPHLLDRYTEAFHEVRSWTQLAEERSSHVQSLYTTVSRRTFEGRLSVQVPTYPGGSADVRVQEPDPIVMPSVIERPVIRLLKSSQVNVWKHALEIPGSFTLSQFKLHLKAQGRVIGSDENFPTSDEALRRTLMFLTNIGALIMEMSGELVRWRRPEPLTETDHVEV